jgi:hypothetical protein
MRRVRRGVSECEVLCPAGSLTKEDGRLDEEEKYLQIY